ncbi:MAG: DUF2169 domain-containing protein [Minicystis sp.]
MFAVDNPTSLPAALVPGLDEEGRANATVVVKATFRLREGELHLADEQVPIRNADEHHGDPASSSLRYESDLCPQKAGTDIVLVGQAWSPSPTPEIDVVLSAGPLRKAVRVFGDRAFFGTGHEFGISAPHPFTRMPLIYERAYGGADGDGFDAKNPVGIGFCRSLDHADGARLPNLEDPRHLIRHPEDRPPPAGFGFIARHWMPRRALAGTYDEAWRADRCPLLPRDFDRRFYHSASPDLIASRPFHGGEPIRVEGASEGGPIAFRVPRLSLDIAVSIKRSVTSHRPVLDTILIEPDDRRVTLTHRLTFACPRSYLPLDGVRITMTREAA